MKIIHVIFSMEIGGSETMLIDILNEQVKTASNVELIVINKDYNIDLLQTISKDVKVTLLNREKGLGTIWKVLSFNWYLFRLNPDVIHFHNHDAIRLLLFKAKKTILTIHALVLDSKNWRKFDSLCSISEAVQEDVFMRSSLKSILIHNGIYFNKVKGREWCLSKSNFRIVQVGRLDHGNKGQDVLIKAISLLKRDNPDRNIQVDFIGGGESLAYLTDLVASLGLDDVINFIGSKSRSYIYENLCQYDLLIQPSIFEGFGLTVAEGMAARIPVLVSDNDGPMEVINKGQFGFFFEKGNAEDCAEQILAIMKSANLDEMTNLAYNHAYTNFNVEKTAQEYLKLYSK